LANEFNGEILNSWGLDIPDFDNEKEDEIKPEIEFANELLLEHNYLVLYFDNPFDWQVAQEKFKLKQVKSCIKTELSQKSGIGRVLNVSEVLKML